MKFEDIASKVSGIPFISKSNAQRLYNLILSENIDNILELGFAHGTATCHMAAALEEKNAKGLVTAVDLIEKKDHYKPPIEELLRITNLENRVRVVREQTGYVWFLHEEIAENTNDGMCNPIYDLCIIDGPKNWAIDGAAFFMADKLLKTGGWLIFDDYNWTYDAADKRRTQTDGITHRQLSDRERTIPHIKEVFELLVMQHPGYGQFEILPDSDWAIAQKVGGNEKAVRITYEKTYRDFARSWLGKFKYHIKKLFFK